MTDLVEGCPVLECALELLKIQKFGWPFEFKLYKCSDNYNTKVKKLHSSWYRDMHRQYESGWDLQLMVDTSVHVLLQ